MSNNATQNSNVSGATLQATSGKRFVESEVIKTIEESINSEVYSATVKSSSAVGYGSLASIGEGVYFVAGIFVKVYAQTLILDKYSNTPSYKIGLFLNQTFIDSTDDPSLVDTARGYPNFNAPGADRLKLELQLRKISLDSEEDQNFIELLRLKEGVIQYKVSDLDYSELQKLLARRTFDESGNYTVRKFDIEIRNHLNNGSNRGLYTVDSGGDETKLIAALNPGKAYVQGFEIQTLNTIYVPFDKARDTAFARNSVVNLALGNYVDVTNLTGIPDINDFPSVNFRNAVHSGSTSSGTLVGSAKVRQIEHLSGSGSTAIFRLWLFDVAMVSSAYRFQTSVKSIVAAGSPDFLSDVVLDSNGYGYLSDPSKVCIVYPTDYYVKTIKDSLSATDVSYTVRRSFDVIMTGDDAILTAGTNEFFKSYSTSNYCVSIITPSATATGNGYVAGDLVSISSVSLGGSPTGKQVTITKSDIAGSTLRVVAQVFKSNAPYKTKTLTSRSQVFVTPGSSDLQLDKADIYKITSIISNSVDITDHYKLDNGQRDSYYDRGKLTLIGNAPTTNVTVNYQYFDHSASGDYFVADSYTSAIDYENIPSYQPTSGSLIWLSDAVDFRPRINDSGTDFSVFSEIGVPNDIMQISLEYYLGRIDKLYLDYKGNFGVKKGVPALNPKTPSDPNNAMVLYILKIKPYTRFLTDVGITLVKNRVYTMKDIGLLDQRIQNLEYYVSLTLLEKDTKDLFIPDAYGLNRFKNGFLVDNFTGHLVGDATNQDYLCAIEPETRQCRPTFSQDNTKFDLDTTNSTNYSKTGDLITLPYTEEDLIVQPYNSRWENVNPYNIFNWVGVITLTPSSDDWKDITIEPDLVATDTNNTAAIQAIATFIGTRWNDWQTQWSGTSLIGVSENSQTFEINNGTGTTTTTTNTYQVEDHQVRTGQYLEVNTNTYNQDLGDRVIDTSLIPYMRSIDIAFEAKQLKPNTRVYAYFDSIDVTPYCTPTTLVTDNSGFVEGVFTVPSSDAIRFRTGNRVFRLTDDENNSFYGATTAAEVNFESSGLHLTHQRTILSTQLAQVVPVTVSDTRVVYSTYTTSSTNTTVVDNPEPEQTPVFEPLPMDFTGGGDDPLAQTFFVTKKGGVFLSSITLYFKTKDNSLPVQVQIREVDNGYPSRTVLPFSSVVKNASEVEVSDDGTVGTTFYFNSPIYVSSDTEYCFVVLADTNNYNCWTAKIGDFQYGTDRRISNQPYTGSLFKSQNSSTWTADQEQDLKFTLRCCNFSTNVTGNVIFTNKDVPLKLLTKNPITTVNGSNNITIYCANHGLQDGDKVIISGANTINGINATYINAEQTVIDVIDLDYFTIDILDNTNTPVNANASGTEGGSTVYCKPNIPVNLVNLNTTVLVLPSTSLNTYIKTSSKDYQKDSEWNPIELKENFEITEYESILFNSLNEQNDSSLDTKFTLATSNTYLSPVIDTTKNSAILVANRINNPVLGSNGDLELLSTNGDAIARYITKKVVLLNPANDLYVQVAGCVQLGTYVDVYFKNQNIEDDSIQFEDLPWQKMVLSEEVPYSTTNKDFRDRKYITNTTLGEFSSYAIKVVFKSDTTALVPKIRDFRVISILD